MSLTNIVYTPVDTGLAKIRLNVENPKVRFFYLLAGKTLQLGWGCDVCPDESIRTGSVQLFGPD